MGFDGALCSVSSAADGKWMDRAKQLLDIPVEAANSEIKKNCRLWIPAVSSFLTSVNEAIATASVHEVHVVLRPLLSHVLQLTRHAAVAFER
jgi:hypothetical protein